MAMPCIGGARAILALGFLLLAVLLVLRAWIGDDAYITLRTVENAARGHGLRWNLADRVQTYTHPLWMGMVLLARVCTGELYFTVLALNFLLSIGAVVLLCARVAMGTPGRVAAIAALLGSRAFLDYSGSGLENPLTHLLLLCFVVRLAMLLATPSRRGAFELALLAALLATNRLDSILLVLPASICAWQRLGWRASLAPVALGFLPLALWLTFAAVYYGTPFPITAYAKAFTPGIAQSDLAWQSLFYFRWLLLHDPLTALLTTAGIVVAVVRRGVFELALAAGALLYLLYLVKIGGDFMGGRLFTGPFLLSLAILLRARPRRPWAWAVAVAALAALAAVLRPTPPAIDAHDIADERAYYSPRLGLCSETREIPVFGSLGRELFDPEQAGRPVLRFSMAGVTSFRAGPRVYVLDVLLTDPLLARLPVPDPKKWRIGHYARRVPEGYVETLVAGEAKLHHPGLARYTDSLLHVLRGDLFSATRLSALVELWTGAHADGLREYLEEEYRSPPRVRVPLRDLQAQRPSGALPFQTGFVHPCEGGLEIRAEQVLHAEFVDFGADRFDVYRLRFFSGDTSRGETFVQTESRPYGLENRRVPVPESARAEGFDRVWIDVISTGDACVAVGHFIPVPQ